MTIAKHRDTIMIRNSRSFLAVALVSIAASAVSVTARQPEIGARPLGMGETFLAVADDGNALLWNPAGLPSLGHHEIIASHADLFGIGIDTNNFGYVFPMKDDAALGFDWNNLGSSDSEFEFKKDSFRFSYGHRVRQGLSLGLGVRYLTTDMILDNQSLGNGSGWGLDLAALYALNDQLNLAVAARDVMDTKARYKGRGTDTIAERQLRAGLAYRPSPELTVASDVDDQFHLGAEYWHENILALRAGVQKDLTETSEPLTYAAGLGLRYNLFRFDYAYVAPPTLPASSRFSVSLFFNLYPSQVRIAETEFNNVFPAFHKHYATAAVGKVKLHNRGDKPLKTTLSFYIPELMAVPTDQQVIVRPKETKQVEVTGVFSNSVTELTEDILTQAQIEVSYTAEQRTRSDKKSAGLFVYNRNAMVWDDLKRAAAFVTSTDPSIAEFARSTILGHEEEVKQLGRGSRNMLRALVLFEAVKEHGVRYIADPNNPYSRMSADKSAVDNIQYPAEVLRRKSGDCDDLTALYCALLENVGIPTALVDAPGHIFMMFDSGVPVDRGHALPMEENMYVARHGHLWIPVEITLFGDSFVEAWKSGAGECTRLEQADRLMAVDTAEAWAVYEPSPPKFEDEIRPPDKEHLTDSFSAGLVKVRDMMQSFIDRVYVRPLQESPEDLDRMFDLAQVYVFIRQFDEAIAQYRRLEDLEAEPGRLYNNWGIAYFVKGEVENAALSFKKALDIDPNDRGTRANFDLAMSELGEQERVAFAQELGVSVSGETKAAEFEIDEESFYWKD